MFHVIAVTYPAEEQAEKAVAQIQRLPAEELADLDAIVYLSRDAAGMFHLHWHDDSFTTNCWEVLLDALLLALTAGLPLELRDGILDASFSNRLSLMLSYMNSAIMIGMRQVMSNKLLPELRDFGGIVLQTTVLSLAETEMQLRKANKALVV